MGSGFGNIRCFPKGRQGRRVLPVFDEKMYILLRKGNFDPGFTEESIDSLEKLTADTEHAVGVRDPDAQLEIERTCAKSGEYG